MNIINKIGTKPLQAIAVGGIIATILLTGTFAWASFTQSRLNMFRELVVPDVNLHDDFAGGPNKDVYVENSGREDIFLRIRLTEYLQSAARGSLVEGHLRDDAMAQLWAPHNATKDGEGSVESCTLRDGNQNSAAWGSDSFHDYYTWQMGGNAENPTAQIYYLPATEEQRAEYDENDLLIREPQVVCDPLTATLPGGDAHLYYTDRVKELLENGASMNPPITDEAQAMEALGIKKTNTASVMTMEQWKAGNAAEAADPDYRAPYAKGGYWVIDQADGWCYWADALSAGEATGLLLDAVTRTKKDFNSDAEYAVNVWLQATDIDNLGEFEMPTVGGITEDGIKLLQLASGKLVPGGDGTYTPTANPDGTPITDGKQIYAVTGTSMANGVYSGSVTETGTLAWQGMYSTPRAANLPPQASVNLHDDYAEGDEKDIYAENSGSAPLLVRIKLSEYMELYDGAVKTVLPPDALDDANATNWHRHGSTDSSLADCGFEAHDYFDWQPGGCKPYMPAPPGAWAQGDPVASDYTPPRDVGDLDSIIDYAALLDAVFAKSGNSVAQQWLGQYTGGNGTNAAALQAAIAALPADITVSGVRQYDGQPEAETVRRLNEVRLTQIPAPIVSMADWTVNRTPGDRWVMDSDGWCYWAQSLPAGAATGQLLQGAQYRGNATETILYKIRAAMDATTTDEASVKTFISMTPAADNITENARILMMRASGAYIYGADGKFYLSGGRNDNTFNVIEPSNGSYAGYNVGDRVCGEANGQPGDSNDIKIGDRLSVKPDGTLDRTAVTHTVADIVTGENGHAYLKMTGENPYICSVLSLDKASADYRKPKTLGTTPYSYMGAGTDGLIGTDDDRLGDFTEPFLEGKTKADMGVGGKFTVGGVEWVVVKIDTNGYRMVATTSAPGSTKFGSNINYVGSTLQTVCINYKNTAKTLFEYALPVSLDAMNDSVYSVGGTKQVFAMSLYDSISNDAILNTNWTPMGGLWYTRSPYTNKTQVFLNDGSGAASGSTYPYRPAMLVKFSDVP